MSRGSKIPNLKNLMSKYGLSKEEVLSLLFDLLSDKEEENGSIKKLKKSLQKGEKGDFNKLDLDKIYNEAFEEYTNNK